MDKVKDGEIVVFDKVPCPECGADLCEYVGFMSFVHGFGESHELTCPSCGKDVVVYEPEEVRVT